MFNFCLCLALIMLLGCSKKRTPLGNIPVPKMPDKVDLLPSVINVKYHEGVSGVDSCKSCHSEIHAEWQKSFHSKSTHSEAFKKQSDNFNFKGCVSCHAPEAPNFDANRPEARSWKVHEGVTCSACHVVGNRTLGTLGSNAPHRTFKEEKLRTELACISCHQQTVEQWRVSSFKEQNISCQQCHMPYKRRFISDFHKLYNKKDSRSHTFEIDFNNCLKLDLNVSKLTGQIQLKASNTGAGHSIPTGIYGDAALFLEFSVLKGSSVVFFREERLSSQDKTAIPVDGHRIFFYNFRAKPGEKYLVRARAIFNSSNYLEDKILDEIEQPLQTTMQDTQRKKFLLH